MNLRQRYRGSIYRRTLKFLISYSFLFSILFYANTYSKFATAQTINPQAEIAKWEVEVSDGTTNNTTITLVPDGGASKMHLGTTGHFDIVINPNNTEVSMEYIINFENLPDGLTVTTYEILEDNNEIQYTILNNTIEDYIGLNANKDPLSSLDSRTLRVYWQFDGISIDVDNLTSGDTHYTIDVAVTTRQSIIQDPINVNVTYVFAENEVTFNGRSSINTGIPIFSEENANKDFEITANVANYSYIVNQTNSYNTFISCIDGANLKNQGVYFCLRGAVTGTNASPEQFYFIRNVDSSNKNTEVYPTANVTMSSIRLVKENNILYYDLNNTGNLTQDVDYSNIAYFNSPLTFGCASDSNSNNSMYSSVIMSHLTLTTTYNVVLGNMVLPTPTRTNYAFGGWYTDSEFTNKAGDGGDAYNLASNVILYAKWTQNDFQEQYINVEGRTFNGSNAIDTHVYLFNEQNIHRNFELTFNLSGNSTSDSTVFVQKGKISLLNKNISSVRNFRFSTDKNGIHPYSTETSPNAVNIDYKVSETNKIRFVRINDIIYYSINDYDLVAVCDNKNQNGTNSYYSDLPLVLGSSVDANGAFNNRNCRDTLSNISLRFISDNASIEDYRRTRSELIEVYRQDGDITFNGSSDFVKPINSQYFPDGLCLLNQYNYDKDFQITFTIKTVSRWQKDDTIFNMKREKKSDNYPGSIIKIVSSNNITFGSRGGYSGKQEPATAVSVPIDVEIKRENQKVYFYINGVQRQMYDYTAFTAYHNIEVLFGCAFDSDDTTKRRWFSGTLSDILIKMEP